MEEREVQYDKKYKIGNTTIYIVFPKITSEENEKRKAKVIQMASVMAQDIIKEI
ncbi:hypothetical protein ACJDU8_12890 [Clostridium sp. WILCCON 0269]|uniref:Transposase n=1 Tax=Candidatus Clostridium eludens TaxID=3381663 RepID=A0ABW8SKF1_9CLOT